MGFFDSSTKTGPAPVIKETPWGPEMRNYLTQLMQGAGEGVPTRTVAGMSEAEIAGMGILKSIMAGDSFADPTTSPAYLGYRRASMAEEDRGASRIRRGAQIAGMGGSGRAAGAEGRYRSDMANNRMSLLGQLFETERNRDNPYTRLNAAMTVGALPRLIEDAGNNSQYDTLMKVLMMPYQEGGKIANSLLNYQPWYTPTEISSPSMFSQIASVAAPIAGMALGGPIGGAIAGKLFPAPVPGGGGSKLEMLSKSQGMADWMGNTGP